MSRRSWSKYLNSSSAIFDAIGNGESQLENSVGTGFLQVVAADGNAVESI